MNAEQDNRLYPCAESPSETIGLSADDAREIAVDHAYGLLTRNNHATQDFKWTCHKITLTHIELNNNQWPIYEIDLTMIRPKRFLMMEFRWKLRYQLDAMTGKVVGYEDLGDNSRG